MRKRSPSVIRVIASEEALDLGFTLIRIVKQALLISPLRYSEASFLVFLGITRGGGHFAISVEGRLPEDEPEGPEGLPLTHGEMIAEGLVFLFS